MCASPNRSFQNASAFLSRVKIARSYFPVVGIGAFDGLAQPSTERKNAKSRGRGKRARGKRLLCTTVESFQTSVHLGSCQNHRTHVQSLVHRCQRSVRTKMAQLLVNHITLPGFILISACCVAKLDIAHQNVPTNKERLHFLLANVHLVHTLWAVQCSMPCVLVQRSKKPKKIKARMTSNTLLFFSIKSLEGFPILDPVADQYEDITIETTDVGFTFAGGETDAASTNIWIPHAEFPQGISVHVVKRVDTLSHWSGCDP